VCSSTGCVVGSFAPVRKNIYGQHTTGGRPKSFVLTGLSGRDFRQQLKKSPQPIVFDGGRSRVRVVRLLVTTQHQITRFFHHPLAAPTKEATRSDLFPSPPSPSSYGSLGLARVRLLPTAPTANLDPTTDSATLRIQIAFHWAFRTLIPLPHHRTPWTASNAYWAVLPFLPLGFMAYLVRRRDTFVIRLLLLPSVIFLSIRFAHGCVSPSISATYD